MSFLVIHDSDRIRKKNIESSRIADLNFMGANIVSSSLKTRVSFVLGKSLLYGLFSRSDLIVYPSVGFFYAYAQWLGGRPPEIFQDQCII